MANYILEVNLCWLGFYLLYSFVLSRETFFEYNRWYLLGGLLGGLFIPLVEYPIVIEQIVEMPTLTAADLELLANMQMTAVAVEESNFEQLLPKLLWGGYLIGVVVLLLRFTFGLSRIAYLYWNGKRVAMPGYALIKTPSVHPPFSFFHWLFQSQKIALAPVDEEKIIAHEIEHMRQWHSLDILLLEFLGILVWFSPLIWLYRRSLRMIHEYQADEAVLQTTQRKIYGHLLIRQSMSGPPIAIANHFIHSQLKKRLTMMTKKKSTQRSLMKYAFIIPILALFLMAFAPTKVYVPVVPDTASLNDPEPDLGKIKAELAAILGKRAYAKSNIDKEIAGKFAMTYDKFIKSYPVYQKEITDIAVAVAADYEMDAKVENNRLISGQFRQPFQPNEWEEKITKDAAKLSIKDIISKDEATPNANPLYVINGKTSTKAIVDNLDTESIEKINVLKGESALKGYGTAGQHGVVEIYTKGFLKEKVRINASSFEAKEEMNKEKAIDASEQVNTFKEETITLENEAKGTSSTIKIRGTADGNDKQPLFVVDGEILEQLTPFSNIDPNDIQSINVLKGDVAIEKYGDKAINGVGEITTKKSKVATEVEEMPLFPGVNADERSPKERKMISDKMMLGYIFKNVKYPKAAKDAGIEGVVIVNFVIDEKGYTKDFKILREPSSELGQEALRVAKSMPTPWTPGKNQGKAVATEFNLPIKFKLNDDNPKEIFKVVEEMPLFPGINSTEGTPEERKLASDQKMLEYIFQHIEYPKIAKDNGVEGICVIQFVIEKDGTLSDPKIVRDIGAHCGEEALRVVESIPGKWTPGKQKGKAVATLLNIPIKFALNAAKPTGDDTAPIALPIPETSLELQNFKLTPNPNNGEMVVSFQAESHPVLIQVFDIKGQEVYKDYRSNFGGDYQQTIRLEKATKGQYILSVTQDQKRFTAKFVTQ
ncbi:MAG: TonB family protein [Saprospiraceae bacterium]